MKKLLLLLMLCAPAASAADATLPVIESPSTRPSPWLAIVISGDGGWARIDKSLATELNAAGVSVAGLNAAEFFWKRKTPAELAAAVTMLIRTYSARWHRPEVVLVGYSRGADVLPFAVNRLAAPDRSRVKVVALLAPARMTSFELHLADYFRDAGDTPVVPELQKLERREPVLCFYGEDEHDSACTAIAMSNLQQFRMPGGHHFDGAYVEIAGAILRAIGVTR